MNRSLPFQQRVLALVVSLLLFAQVMGLHRHLHTEAGLSAHGVQSELHFGDAGLHPNEHAHADEGAPAMHHAHGDVEVSGIGDALAKLSINLLPIGLLMAALFLLAAPIVRRARLAPYTAAPLRRHPFLLHPPANGPPRLFSAAV